VGGDERGEVLTMRQVLYSLYTVLYSLYSILYLRCGRVSDVGQLSFDHTYSVDYDDGQTEEGVVIDRVFLLRCKAGDAARGGGGGGDGGEGGQGQWRAALSRRQMERMEWHWWTYNPVRRKKRGGGAEGEGGDMSAAQAHAKRSKEIVEATKRRKEAMARAAETRRMWQGSGMQEGGAAVGGAGGNGGSAGGGGVGGGSAGDAESMLPAPLLCPSRCEQHQQHLTPPEALWLLNGLKLGHFQPLVLTPAEEVAAASGEGAAGADVAAATAIPANAATATATPEPAAASTNTPAVSTIPQRITFVQLGNQYGPRLHSRCV
jgi:hypothetical protein